MTSNGNATFLELQQYTMCRGLLFANLSGIQFDTMKYRVVPLAELELDLQIISRQDETMMLFLRDKLR
jgi:hypothetical protein